MFLLLHLIIFSIKHFLCHDGKGENSAHRLSLASRPSPPPCQHQWAAACLFWRLDLNSFTFFANVFLLHRIFFNYILSVPWWERWTLSPQKECGLPLPSQPCQYWEAAAGMFWGWVVSSFTFFAHVCYCIWFLFKLNNHCSGMKTMRTQSTDWVWSPALITAFPSLIHSSGYILRVSFHSLPLYL